MKATRSLDVHQAKAELSTLIKAVERGREVIICRNGKPVARLAAQVLGYDVKALDARK